MLPYLTPHMCADPYLTGISTTKYAVSVSPNFSGEYCRVPVPQLCDFKGWLGYPGLNISE